METFTNPPIPIDFVVSASFYTIFAIYVIFSIILSYHWKNYGTDLKVTTTTMTIYLVTTVPLIVIMFILALTI